MNNLGIVLTELGRDGTDPDAVADTVTGVSSLRWLGAKIDRLGGQRLFASLPCPRTAFSLRLIG
jgi:hypothetical protein